MQVCFVGVFLLFVVGVFCSCFCRGVVRSFVEVCSSAIATSSPNSVHVHAHPLPLLAIVDDHCCTLFFFRHQ